MAYTVFMLLGVVLLAVSAAVFYGYMLVRELPEGTPKGDFRLSLDKKKAIFLGTAFALAGFLFLRGCFREEGYFLRSFMNAEVFLWLAVIGYIDLKEKIIPNQMILAGLGFWAVLMLLEILLAGTEWKSLITFSLLGGCLFGGILMVIALIVKSALGMGDVKMFFVIGLLYGLVDTYTILLFSMAIMAVISIILLLFKKVTTKTAIPMAPFTALGFLLCVLSGM